MGFSETNTNAYTPPVRQVVGDGQVTAVSADAQSTTCPHIVSEVRRAERHGPGSAAGAVELRTNPARFTAMHRSAVGQATSSTDGNPAGPPQPKDGHGSASIVTARHAPVPPRGFVEINASRALPTMTHNDSDAQSNALKLHVSRRTALQLGPPAAGSVLVNR